MASYEVSENQTLTVSLLDDFTDQGWIVSQGIAFHSGCNSGYIRLNIDLSSYTSWTFIYTVQSISSGIVRIVVDGVSGTDRSLAGTYEETFSSSNPNAVIEFFATGICAISSVSIFSPETTNEGRTLSFNEDANRWVTDHSFVPEFMNKFINSFFTFKGGELWEHNVNDLRNNYYGVQYPSVIEFYINVNNTVIKTLSSMRMVGNVPWNMYVDIRPREGKSIGQRSRRRANDFKNLQGQWFADFLKDMNDPRFSNETEALWKGADLQCDIAKIRIEINTDKEVRLLSVDTLGPDQQYSY